MKIKETYLVSIQALLFVIFLLTTFFFNRFAADDYHFIGELFHSSPKEIYADMYYNWHGRWTSNFLMVYGITFNSLPFFLFTYNLLSLLVLYIAVLRLFKSVNDFYNFNFSKNLLLIYSLAFISVFFFSTISPNDSWIWYTSSIVYLWSSIAFFFGVNIFFKLQKTILDYVALILCAVYIGGSNEPLTIILFGLLILVFIKKKGFLPILGITLLISSFLINYLSSGTSHRDEVTPTLGVLDLILYTGYSSLKFLFFTIHKTFFPALLLALPFYLLGKRATYSVANFKPLKGLIISLLLIGGLVILNQFIIIFALGSLSPDRAGITSSIFIAIIIIRYVFLLGAYYSNKKLNLKFILILNVTGLIVFNVYYFNMHMNYAKAVDARIEKILADENEIIVVEPLPESGYIYSAEITIDAQHYKNQHLKKGLQKQSLIVKKKN